MASRDGRPAIPYSHTNRVFKGLGSLLNTTLKSAIAQKTGGFRTIAKQVVEMLRVFQQPAEGRWMDFGRILDDWETIEREHKDSVSASQTPHAPSPKPPDDSSKAKGVLESWLEKNVITDKRRGGGCLLECSRKESGIASPCGPQARGCPRSPRDGRRGGRVRDRGIPRRFLSEGTRESTDHPRERPALFRNPRSQKGGEEGDRGAPGCGAIRRGQKD